MIAGPWPKIHGRRAPTKTVSDQPDTAAPIAFDNTYARELEGCYKAARPAPAQTPSLVAFNADLGAELGLSPEALDSDRGARVFTGQELLPGSEPIALAYAGHQFGHFVPQLGDGRALLLGEVLDVHGQRRDIQLKGSGPTHFSRGGDGLAPLGPVLREYLVGEAMHALGVPTTRALAAATTGELVYRDEPLPGAVITRVAASHLRVGTFQYFAARGELEQLRRLVDYAIRRHDPDLADSPDRDLEFLARVRDRQAALIAHWMSLGFVHGVMNTDNTAISGETIDYGPCAFMERYDPETVFSSIDRNGRYCFGRQPRIALWNLARFAETLIPLASGDGDAAVERATEVIELFGPHYERAWLGRMRAKLGLALEEEDDWQLVQDLHKAMNVGEADFTNTFRALVGVGGGELEALRSCFEAESPIEAWIERYRARLALEPATPAERSAAMRATNPAYIPRNHKVEEALDAANRGDLEPFRALLAIVSQPFDERPGLEAFARPAPRDDEPYVTFCGT